MKTKTHSGAKKRFMLTGKGKVRFNKAAHNHLMVGKSKRQKRSSRKGVIAESLGEIARVRHMLAV